MDEEILEREQTPDVDALQARLSAAEAENRLYRLAPGLGVSAAAVPYLARLCPVSEGDDDAVRAALEKVLQDLPGLRASPGTGSSGGFRVGAGAAPAQSDDELIRAAFGIR